MAQINFPDNPTNDEPYVAPNGTTYVYDSGTSQWKILAGPGVMGPPGATGPAFIKMPQNAKTSSYILLATDSGKHISITTGGVTVPESVFAVGDIVTIFNNSSSSQTITQGSGVTLRQAGTTNTGDRTLLSYGVSTILCVDTNVFTISGA